MANFKEKLKELLATSESLEERVGSLQKSHDTLKDTNSGLMEKAGELAKEIGKLQATRERLNDKIEKETADFENYTVKEEERLNKKRAELILLNNDISAKITEANELAATNESQEENNRVESLRLNILSNELIEKKLDLDTQGDGIAHREGIVRAGEVALAKQQKEFEKQIQEQIQEYQKVIEQSKVNEGKLKVAKEIDSKTQNFKKELNEKAEFLNGREKELREQEEKNNANAAENAVKSKNLSDKAKNLKALEGDLLLEAAKYKKKK